MNQLMETAGMRTFPTPQKKHTRTFGMIERSHAKLKKTLKINSNVDKPQRGQNFDIAIMPHNTTYHTSLKCSPTETFHGRIP